MVGSIIKTCEEAITAKASCARLGYHEDPYAIALSPNKSNKSPLVNRGYWARIKVVESVVEDFIQLHKGQSVQILNIGAGMDTLFFRMHDAKLIMNVKKFVEMDYPEVISRKINAVERKAAFHKITKGWKFSLKDCEGGAYAAFGGDLRRLDDLEQSLKTYGLDFASPTLILSECVTCYMEVKYSDELINWFTKVFKGNVALLAYEQILPGTRFGKVMVKNLHTLGLPTASLFKYPTMKTQEKRYTERGFEQAAAKDLKFLYNEYIDQKECSRIARIELLDEFEE